MMNAKRMNIPNAFCPRLRQLLGVAGWKTALLFTLAGIVGCEDDSARPTGKGGDVAAEPEAPAPLVRCAGSALFGRPSPSTGLSAEQCTPTCPDCEGGPFVAQQYDDTFVSSLRAFVLLDPPAPLESNPYAEPARATAEASAEPGAVCAVHVENTALRTYRLRTWPSSEEASNNGGIVTHEGACGLCSDLESLAVYAGEADLTAPVRACGVEGVLSGDEANLACLRKLGFNEACASIWFWNTINTRARCQDVCLELLNAPYHNPDGSLNACLQCDEDESGPVFKAVAGRTRRNSGLANALCRPCAEVLPIEHRYE
jgi:hypothetical protein